MNYYLKNKNAVILASSKGLGKSVSEALFKEGCNIAICSSNLSSIHKTANELRKKNNYGKIISSQVDINNKQELTNFFTDIKKQFNPIDILILNNSGPKKINFLETNENDWKGAFESLLMTFIRSIKLSMDSMKYSNNGRIIAISSLTSKSPIPGYVLSSTIRAGLLALMKTLSYEVAKYRITVNTVCTGYAKTQRIIDLAKSEAKVKNININDIIDDWVEQIPLKRLIEPSELSSLICYLCSKQASAITGTSFGVDCGLYKGIL